MQQTIDKKEFALAAIAPYFKDPSKCGYENGRCLYETSDGRTCVAGQFMFEGIRQFKGGIDEVIVAYDGQKNVFVKGAADVLTDEEWGNLQALHDGIADKDAVPDGEQTANYWVRELGLFTMDELIDYSNKN